MLIFGWLVVTVIAVLMSAGIACLALFMGRIDGEVGFLGAVAVLLWWASYSNFPFTVGLAA